MTATDVFKEKWAGIRQWVKEQWGDKITDADLDQVAGQREQLCHLLSEKCGLSERVANQEINKALDSITWQSPFV